MATFAEYILNEPDFIKKIDIMTYLKKKQNIFFNTSVIMKAEIAREFMDTMKLDVDQGLVLTACLMYDCLKIDSPEELVRLQKSQAEYRNYLRSLGFNDRFCKICAEHSRVGQDPSVTREKESDILELVDNFGGMLLDRPERAGYSPEKALIQLEESNLRGKENIYLEQFKQFVEQMQEVEV